MIKKFLVFLIYLAGICTIYAHSSFDMHYRDISCIFNGYGNDIAFKELSKEISSGIDSELPKLFKERFGKVPGNHRILGHGWTLNSSIPERVLDELEKTYPGKRAEFIDLWSKFAKKLTMRAEELTGLPAKQAKALATMMYDIHLLGDLEPDNTLVKYVLTPKEIVNDFNKNAEILFKNKPEYAKSITSKLLKALKTSSKLEQQYVAQNLMDLLYRSHIGTMVKDTWNNTLKMEYSPDAVVSANQKAVARSLQQIEGASSKRLTAASLSKIQMKGPYTKVTTGILTKVPFNGRNISVLKVLTPLKTGAGYGVLTFAISEGISCYSYSNNKIAEREFRDETFKNMGESAIVATVTVIMVACGSNPVGWTVFAVGVGTSIIYELTYTYAKTPKLVADDFIGDFPEGIFENNRIFTLCKDSRLIFEKGTDIVTAIHTNILQITNKRNILESNNRSNIIEN